MRRLQILVFAAAFIVVLANQSFAQANGCTTSNGVVVDVKPVSPLQFQFFPVSLFGIGGGETNFSAFQNFGIQFTGDGVAERRIELEIGLENGGASILKSNLKMTVVVPATGTNFVGTPALLSGKLSGRVRTFGSVTRASLSDKFVNNLKGGFPSGTFIFPVKAAAEGQTPTFCGQIVVEILTGATVDLTLPASNSEVSSLPQFQWTAVGGQKFRLNVAKLRAGQTAEEALNNSTQRFIVELNGNSYQVLSGGPVSTGLVRVVENNLTWSPGLGDGEYVCRVTMIQEDPISRTQNFVRSAVVRFSVRGGATINVSGLNTQEIIGILQAAAKGVNIEELLQGFEAYSIEINGKPATVDELRTKLVDLGSAKWEIKP